MRAHRCGHALDPLLEVERRGGGGGDQILIHVGVQLARAGGFFNT